MLVPVDADAAVCEALVASVERDVVTDFILVLPHEGVDAFECGLLLDGEEEDEVASGLYVRRVERAYHGEQGLDVARVVADAGRVQFAVAHLDLDLQALLKDRVHVRVKDDDRAAASAAARGDDVADGVAPNIHGLVAAQNAFDEGGALLLPARRRVDFG